MTQGTRQSNPTATIEYLSQAEVKRLFDAAKANPRDEAILRLAYWVGLRASEVGKLRRDDYDSSTGRLRVNRVKGSLSGNYRLSKRIKYLLNKMLKDRDDDCPALFISNRKSPISRRSLDVIMKKHAEAAGIAEHKRHFHVLKHSIVMHMLDAGKDLIEVQQWVGHRNIQNTMHYVELHGAYRDETAHDLMDSDSVVS